jgi:transcriptional regulator with XRE-family HTH domain
MVDFSKEEALSKLAKRIKNLRHQKGVTQQDAYNDTGIHFARIEQGRRDVNYTTLLRIAGYFDITIEKLLSD